MGFVPWFFRTLRGLDIWGFGPFRVWTLGVLKTRARAFVGVPTCLKKVALLMLFSYASYCTFEKSKGFLIKVSVFQVSRPAALVKRLPLIM